MKLCPKCGNQFSNDANFCPVDAGRLTAIDSQPSADSAPGADALNGRFTLGERIGGSATGEVYAATDKQGVECVVKLVDRAVFSTPLVLQRTERELKQLERLETTSVAKVLDHGKRDGRLWVALQRVSGRPLSEIVAESGPLPADRAAAIIRSVAQALAEAAKLGVIHRDVAPKNVLLGSGDQVHVINFGIAVPTTEKLQGMVEFVAPEVLEGKPVDQRSNIYSLGALHFYLLTGRPPFAGDADTLHAVHLTGDPPVLDAAGGVEPGLEALILRALERTSSKRFMTLRQLLAELEGLGAPGATQPLGRVGASGKPKEKQRDVAKTLLGVPLLADSVVAAAAAQVSSSDSFRATDVMATAPVETVTVPNGASPNLAPPLVDAAPATPSPSPVPESTDVGKENSASGKRRDRAKKKQEKKAKAGFRETMWFKKGELDEAAAEVADVAKDDLASVKADEKTIEDRYGDDGSLTARDQERLSLRTGRTEAMRAMRPGEAEGPRANVSEDDLVSEMRSGRTKILILVALGILALIAIIVVAFNK